MDIDNPESMMNLTGQNEPVYNQFNSVDLEEIIHKRGFMDRNKRWGIFEFDGNDELANIGRYVETQVFGEFFDNNPDEMSREYGPYEKYSRFIVVADQKSNRPAGVMRLINNSEEGLKSLNDIERVWKVSPAEVIEKHEIDIDRTLDIATLAVPEEYRRQKVTPILYWHLYTSSLERGVENWVTILDVKVLSLLQGVGIEANAICGLEPREYIGSPASQPVIMRVDDMANSVKAVSRLNYLIMGKGWGIKQKVSLP